MQSEHGPESVQSEAVLAERMALAITRIERQYDPTLRFTKPLDEAKAELDACPLVNLDDVDRWELGWLQLIELAKYQRRHGLQLDEVKQC